MSSPLYSLDPAIYLLVYLTLQALWTTRYRVTHRLKRLDSLLGGVGCGIDPVTGLHGGAVFHHASLDFREVVFLPHVLLGKKVREGPGRLLLGELGALFPLKVGEMNPVVTGTLGRVGAVENQETLSYGHIMSLSPV
jgi:hypothetical protein